MVAYPCDEDVPAPPILSHRPKMLPQTVTVTPRHNAPWHSLRERGVSGSEFIRQLVARALEQYRRRPKPTSAGIVRALTERGDERELLGGGR
jgi:hypothetical protein